MSAPSPSTRNPEALPSPEQVKRLFQSLAVLDAILCPEWDGRYYSFDARWDTKAGVQVGSMRDGSGDEFFAVFASQGAVILGCAHEADLKTPVGLFEGMPPDLFETAAKEPAFSPDAATFCLWYTDEAGKWQIGPVSFSDTEDVDGSAELLAILRGDPEVYASWAEEYYELELDQKAVMSIYQHTPLTQDLVSALNTERRLQDLVRELEEIAYPYMV